MSSHTILGFSIDDIPISAIVERMRGALLGRGNMRIATANAEMLRDAYLNPSLADALSCVEIRTADAVAVRFAVTALTDTHLQYRVTGVQLFENLCALCKRERAAMLIVGSNTTTVKQAYAKMHMGKLGMHIDPGLISIEKGKLMLAPQMLADLRDTQACVIALALDHKKQLLFMRDIAPTLRVQIVIGVGGAVDMIAGTRKRAPQWMRVAGFEWFWRLLIEPSRIGRIIHATCGFPWIVIKQAHKQGRLLRATRRVLCEIPKQLIGQ